MTTLDLAVLASGRGSNLRAVLDAIDAGTCDARVSLVASDKPDAPALELAAKRGIPTIVVRPKDHFDRAAWDRALAEAVAGAAPSLVVLAGFMRIVGPAMLAAFPSRIINVHPALLPSFPGAHGPRDALAHGVTVTGCTVHVVDAGVDTGPILAQGVVPVAPGDDESSLHARIQTVEHRLLPGVIDAIARGALVLDPRPRFVAPFDATGTLLSPPVGSPVAR